MRSGRASVEQSPLLRSPLGISAATEAAATEAAATEAAATEAAASTFPTIVQPSRMSGVGNVSAGEHVKYSVRQEREVRKNLNLRFEYFEYFVYSQCVPAWLLLLLRLVMGCVCTAVFLYMSILSPFVNFGPSNSTSGDADQNGTTEIPKTFKRHFYLCYLTIWSYLILTLYFTTALVNTITMCACAPGSSDFSLAASGFKSTDNLLDTRVLSGEISSLRQFGLRLQWLLCGVAANAALIVTLAYFTVLYPMIRRVNPGPISSVDLLVHGFNSVFMFVEVSLSGVPIRLVHLLYTALYGLTYGLFSLLYWIPDHSNVIYPVLLDWNNAGLTIGMLCLILFIGLPFVQLVWWLVYLVRCFLAAALLSQRADWGPGLSI